MKIKQENQDHCVPPKEDSKVENYAKQAMDFTKQRDDYEGFKEICDVQDPLAVVIPVEYERDGLVKKVEAQTLAKKIMENTSLH